MDDLGRSNISAGSSEVPLGSRGKYLLRCISNIFRIRATFFHSTTIHSFNNTILLTLAYKVSSVDRGYYRTQISPYARPK